MAAACLVGYNAFLENYFRMILLNICFIVAAVAAAVAAASFSVAAVAAASKDLII